MGGKGGEGGNLACAFDENLESNDIQNFRDDQSVKTFRIAEKHSSVENWLRKLFGS
jgi:hypothetical protein